MELWGRGWKKNGCERGGCERLFVSRPIFFFLSSLVPAAGDWFLDGRWMRERGREGEMRGAGRGAGQAAPPSARLWFFSLSWVGFCEHDFFLPEFPPHPTRVRTHTVETDRERRKKKTDARARAGTGAGGLHTRQDTPQAARATRAPLSLLSSHPTPPPKKGKKTNQGGGGGAEWRPRPRPAHTPHACSSLLSLSLSLPHQPLPPSPPGGRAWRACVFTHPITTTAPLFCVYAGGCVFHSFLGFRPGPACA